MRLICFYNVDRKQNLENRMKFIMTFLFLISLLPFNLFAQNGPDGKTPPFVTACSSLKIGDTCTFTGMKGNQINGTCTEKNNPRSGAKEVICWSKEMDKMGPPLGNKKGDGLPPGCIKEDGANTISCPDGDYKKDAGKIQDATRAFGKDVDDEDTSVTAPPSTVVGKH
jgi:hypothetical protein